MRTNKLAELIGENGEIPFSIISVVTVVYHAGALGSDCTITDYTITSTAVVRTGTILVWLGGG